MQGAEWKVGQGLGTLAWRILDLGITGGAGTPGERKPQRSACFRLSKNIPDPVPSNLSTKCASVPEPLCQLPQLHPPPCWPQRGSLNCQSQHHVSSGIPQSPHRPCARRTTSPPLKASPLFTLLCLPVPLPGGPPPPLSPVPTSSLQHHVLDTVSTLSALILPITGDTNVNEIRRFHI